MDLTLSAQAWKNITWWKTLNVYHLETLENDRIETLYVALGLCDRMMGSKYWPGETDCWFDGNPDFWLVVNLIAEMIESPNL